MNEHSHEKRIVAVRLGESALIAVLSAVFSAAFMFGLISGDVENMQKTMQRIEKRVDRIYRDFYQPGLPYHKQSLLFIPKYPVGDCVMTTMAKADLVADLKGILMDSSNKFTTAGDADFERHLNIAAADLARFAPTYKTGTFTLKVDEGEYTSVPGDMLYPSRLLWGEKARNLRQYDPCYPGRLPGIGVGVDATGAKIIRLSPPPTSKQIELLGSDFSFSYVIRYVIDDVEANTTVPERYRAVLLLRAASEALTELALNGVTKPVQLGSSGVGSMPKNGHPSALAEQLMTLAKQLAAA